MENARNSNPDFAITRRSDPAGHVRMSATERRFYRRGRIATPATMKFHDESFTVELVDISAGGAQLRCSVVLRAGVEISIELHGLGALPARVVRRLPNSIAVAFDLSDSLREALAARLDALITATA